MLFLCLKEKITCADYGMSIELDIRGFLIEWRIRKCCGCCIFCDFVVQCRGACLYISRCTPGGTCCFGSRSCRVCNTELLSCVNHAAKLRCDMMRPHPNKWWKTNEFGTIQGKLRHPRLKGTCVWLWNMDKINEHASPTGNIGTFHLATSLREGSCRKVSFPFWIGVLDTIIMAHLPSWSKGVLWYLQLAPLQFAWCTHTVKARIVKCYKRTLVQKVWKSFPGQLHQVTMALGVVMLRFYFKAITPSLVFKACARKHAVQTDAVAVSAALAATLEQSILF